MVLYGPVWSRLVLNGPVWSKVCIGVHCTQTFVGNIRFGFVRQSNILFGAPNICNSCNICNIWQLAGFPPQKVPKVLLHLLQLIALHAGLPS